MKMKSRKRRFRFLAGILPAWILLSCSSEQEISPAPSGSGETFVTFSLRVPGATTPASRGLTEDEENAVAEIDILAFHPVSGKFEFHAGCDAGDITTDPEDSKKKTFTVKLRQGTWDVAVLANARSLVDAATLTGKTKSTLLPEFMVEMPADGKWTAKRIPMWSEVKKAAISEGITLTDVKLARMVARVDVDIPATVSNFKLTGVDLYNYNTWGTLVPAATGAWDKTEGKALTPVVPATSVLTQGPVSYGEDEIDEENNRCFTEIYLFEAENHSDVPDSHDTGKGLTARTCLVIAGIWDANENGDFTDDGEATFYRVDFSTGTGSSQKFLDVLRNHKYIFNIMRVSGPGYEDSQTAFESGPVNIEAGVLEWNDGGMGDIVADGQYMLAVSRGEFSFSRDGRADKREDNVLTIYTDYKTASEDGWRVEKTVDAADGKTEVDWVVFTPANGVAGDKTEVVLTVGVNDTPQDREAEVWIAAGRLRYKVKVRQSLALPLSLKVSDGTNAVTELVFPSGIGNTITPQALQIDWAPSDADLAIVQTQVGSSGFPAGSGAPETSTVTAGNSGTGTINYSINPSPMNASEVNLTTGNPFLEKVSKLEFMTTNGVGYVSGAVFLRQVNYAVITEGLGTYPLKGGTYTFRMKSNTSWRIKSVTEHPSDGWSPMLSLKPTDNLKPNVMGGNNTVTGDLISFTVVTNERGLSGTIDVVLESPDGLFTDKKITINIVGEIWGRSNIVWVPDARLKSGGILTFAVDPDDHTATARTVKAEALDGSMIDVTVPAIPANIQGVFFQWGSLVAISPVGATYNASQVLFSPAGTTNYAKMADIPSLCGYNDPPFDNMEEGAEDDFVTYNGGKGFDAPNGKGDICRYISAQGWVDGKWRLPTMNDYIVLKDPNKGGGAQWAMCSQLGGWTNLGSAPEDDNNAYGFWIVQNGWFLGKGVYANFDPANPEKGGFFPATGYRSYKGVADYAGEWGFFSTGSSCDYDGEWDLRLTVSHVTESGGNRDDSYPVRCIRE